MKMVVVIQARMSSSRLPGKVMAPICGNPLLARMLQRVQLAKQPDAIVVATTRDPADEPIVALCKQLRTECYRGHPEDCLDRHLQVGLITGADAIVKIPSDCPLIDPRVVDQVLATWRRDPQRHDYLSNLHPASWPDGNDVEVMSAAALTTAAAEATDPFDREHTTPFLWTRPERFAVGNVRWAAALDYSQRFRWVVDWPEDLEVVQQIFEQLVPTHGVGFGVSDILALHARRPALEQHNASHRGYHYAADRLEQLSRRQARKGKKRGRGTAPDRPPNKSLPGP